MKTRVRWRELKIPVCPYEELLVFGAGRLMSVPRVSPIQTVSSVNTPNRKLHINNQNSVIPNIGYKVAPFCFHDIHDVA